MILSKLLYSGLAQFAIHPHLTGGLSICALPFEELYENLRSLELKAVDLTEEGYSFISKLGSCAWAIMQKDVIEAGSDPLYVA